MYSFDHGKEHRHDLSRDEAKLVFFNNLDDDSKINVFMISSNCYKVAIPLVSHSYVLTCFSVIPSNNN